ncbi:MAG: NAD(P)-dependent oxidoreductase [Limosilactobacillus sp.]
MAKAKILVTGLVPDQGLAELKQTFEVFHEPKIETRQWILAHLGEYDGLLLAGTRADRELIDAGRRLKIITTFGVGFDHVDIDYAKQRGIVVTNCPKSVRVPTAELTLTLLLATVRRLHFYDHEIRRGNWVNVAQPANMGTSLQGKTLGVYGMGRIGATVARFCRMLGMQIIYNNRHRVAPELEAELAARYVDFATLVKEADVLTLHAPATSATTAVFDAAVFDQMKDTAYLINTARGALVNQDDLIQALEEHQIAGAGLDVFEDEPVVPEALTKLDNVVLSPHVGSGTMDARVAMAHEAANNLIACLRDGRPVNQVNK